MGRMYITNANICFFSMFCGTVVIPFSDVTSIDKSQSMMFLSGVAINTASTCYDFTSFYNREATHDVLQQQWALHKGVGILKRKGSGTSISPAAVPAVASTPSTPTSGVPPLVIPSTQSSAPAAPSHPILDVTTAKESKELEGDAFSVADCSYCTYFSPIQTFKDKNCRLVAEEVVFPSGIGIQGIHHALFSSESGFIQEYHAKRGDVKLEMQSWRTVPSGTQCGYRDFVCITTVKAPFSTQTKYVEWERYDVASLNGQPTLFVRICGATPNVTLGDCFRVEALLEIREDVATQQCSMSVYGYVQFLKSTWMQGRIESTALQSESPAAYKLVSQMAVEKVRQYLSASSVQNTPNAPAAPSDAQAKPGAGPLATPRPQLGITSPKRIEAEPDVPAPGVMQQLIQLAMGPNAIVLLFVTFIALSLASGWNTSVGYGGDVTQYHNAVVSLMRYQTWLLLFIVIYLMQRTQR
jgi:hypothetical protein